MCVCVCMYMYVRVLLVLLSWQVHAPLAFKTIFKNLCFLVDALNTAGSDEEAEDRRESAVEGEGGGSLLLPE